MAKLWAGRTNANTSKLADEFNSSINIDKRMYKEDIEGSIAHVSMLSYCNIILKSEEIKITNGLKNILKDIESGKLKINENAEDIHMFIEETLTKRIGNVGKKLHTARSRNDQVALDIRLYLRKEIKLITNLINAIIKTIIKIAKNNRNVIMSGFTHLQKAQPITFAHYILAYGMMFKRDKERLNDLLKRINISPIGACALAGTTYKTNRKYEAKLLKMDGVCENSIDAVSDRDFIIELASNISIIAMHLSRLAEETVIFTSNEFNYIELSDALTTGSSIMPQKKNSDMAELVRGKTGRVYGNLINILTLLKGLPLAYNKDMQEDKELIFDSIDTIKNCINIFIEMLSTMKINKERMRDDALSGFINATDLADYLVNKGMAFRDAYKLSGKIVNFCIKENNKLNKKDSGFKFTLENLDINTYKKFSKLFSEDVYDFINLDNCVKRRNSYGGTSQSNIDTQIKYLNK
ncbi:MAG: argininosuccinate lyase [Lachnospiraceae bacterium]|nr:argininosuccinate lyase [Lachnospiraceae bacterium]